jgi:Arylsulfotransferase (ASST)
MLAPRTRPGASRTRPPRRGPGALACLVAAALTALAAGCGSAGTGGRSASNGSAPACLPASLDHSAKLTGVPVDVSPAPGTDTANPHTQISFLGVPLAEIRRVSVVGGRSGHHAGRLHGYSQGNGASFVPDTPFAPGEQVVVRATVGTANAGKPIVFGFRVDTPYSTAAVPEFANPAAAPADYQSFDTLPAVQAPILTVTVPDHDPAAGDIFMTNGPGAGQYGPLIYTPQGRLVWFRQLPAGVAADDLSVQSYEGGRDLTFWQGTVLNLGFGQGEDIVMNSNYQEVATIKGGNGLQADLHDFQIAPDQVAYITAYSPIRCDLSSVGGPRNGVILDTAVLEIDIKTGLVRWEWHSLDHVGVGESETSAPQTRAWDWFHLNAIDPQPDGNIFISARNTWAGYQVEGGSGKILWRLGGLKSSFKMGPGTTTAWQHDGRVLPDGDVTIFDDGSNPPVHSQSRAVRIALDFKTHAARLRSAYTHPSPPLLAASQGNMQTLPDGNTVVGYGGVPQISEYANDGSLLFDARLSFDLIFYRGFRFPWSGRPLSPPTAIASLNNTGEETIVHMSWNGASEVASWRVLAGSHPAALRPQTTTQTTGFESSTILPAKYAYAAAQALDSAGHVLGTSHPVAVQSYAASLPTARRSG